MPSCLGSFARGKREILRSASSLGNSRCTPQCSQGPERPHRKDSCLVFGLRLVGPLQSGCTGSGPSARQSKVLGSQPAPHTWPSSPRDTSNQSCLPRVTCRCLTQEFLPFPAGQPPLTPGPIHPCRAAPPDRRGQAGAPDHLSHSTSRSPLCLPIRAAVSSDLPVSPKSSPVAILRSQ